MLSLLVINQGMALYMGWHQHSDQLIDICKREKLANSKTGWSNSFPSVEWLTYLDNITKWRLVSKQQYWFLIFDGCEIHINTDFIEYHISHFLFFFKKFITRMRHISHHIMVYCLLSEYRMEDWESDLEASVEPDSSHIMVATRMPMRHQAPTRSQTPRHVCLITLGEALDLLSVL